MDDLPGQSAAAVCSAPGASWWRKVAAEGRPLLLRKRAQVLHARTRRRQHHSAGSVSSLYGDLEPLAVKVAGNLIV